MQVPPLTPKQAAILKLLYRYRFLNRIQIQSFMQHKDKRRIIAWLKNMREKHYVEWIYSTGFVEKTKPAIYYIGINGVRYLKTLSNENGSEYLYLPSEIRKRYREASRSRAYVDRCMLLADCCIAMEQSAAVTSADANKNTVSYIYETEADYLDPDSTYHFLTESELVHPQLCYKRKERTVKGGTITTYHLLEIFDATLPRYRMSKRLKDYVKYLDEEAYEWREAMEAQKLPIILLVCPRTTDLIYAKRRTRGLLKDIWDDDDRKQMHIRFATVGKMKEFGSVGKIWEEA